MLSIRLWFDCERRELSKRQKAVLEQSRTFDEQAAQYHDEAALTMRAKSGQPDGKGSLAEEETISLQQQEQTIDEYQEVLQRRRLETERASALLSKSL